MGSVLIALFPVIYFHIYSGYAHSPKFFAVHRRGRWFDNPVIAHAIIRKAYIFAALHNRNER
jgi:hypothetical protein